MSVTAHTQDRIWAWQEAKLGDRVSGKWRNWDAHFADDAAEYLLATPAREAADDLLAALEEANTLLQSVPALKNNQRVTDAVHANRAAIAKAKGVTP
ncbi:MAG: hypothetical protein II336_17950 [Loktanella sp.]|nr:hypothetical protein [Loktanella sp.]